MATERVPQRLWHVSGWALRLVTAGALAVSAFVHADLADRYQLNRSGGMSQVELFRGRCERLRRCADQRQLRHWRPRADSGYVRAALVSREDPYRGVRGRGRQHSSTGAFSWRRPPREPDEAGERFGRQSPTEFRGYRSAGADQDPPVVILDFYRSIATTSPRSSRLRR